MDPWINNKEAFWAKRRQLAKILSRPTDATVYQWWWPAPNRSERDICIESCNDPFSGRPLTVEEGIKLLAFALEGYQSYQWEFLPKRDGDDAAAFAVFLLDKMGVQKIYAKISIKENQWLLNPKNQSRYQGDRIRLWSFHPPRK